MCIIRRLILAYELILEESAVITMADAVDEGSSSWSQAESASGGAGGDRETREVRCVVHNFPDDDDDDDAESTIRSLLEPSVIVRHCQLSETGLF